MKKNSITSKISPCCSLPFSEMYWFLKNITLNTEGDREFIISKLSQSGTLTKEAWLVLINSGTLEVDSAMTKAEFLNFIECKSSPDCNELKLIIEGFKIGNYDPNDEKGIGWSEITTFENYDGKVIQKIIGYEGGVGDLPSGLSERIGKYFAENDLTINKDIATDFKPFISLSQEVNQNDETNAVSGKAVAGLVSEIILIKGTLIPYAKVPNCFLINNGDILTSDGYYTTEFIPILDDSLIYKTQFNSGLPSVCIYDENKNIIEGKNSTEMTVNSNGFVERRLADDFDLTDAKFAKISCAVSIDVVVYYGNNILTIPTISNLNQDSNEPINSKAIKPISENLTILQNK